MRDVIQPIKISSIALILATTVLSTGVGPVGAAALYKWIDEDGNIRYSDRLPPKQVKKKHQQLNSQGVVLSTTEEARPEEDIAAEAKAKREAEEKAAADAIVKQAQDKKDRVLLLTFSNESELELARNNRIEVLDSVITLINKSISSTQQKLEQLESSAEQNFKSQGREVPGGLAQKIEHFSRKIENRNEQLMLKLLEKEKINQQYELDLARFRLLKTENN